MKNLFLIRGVPGSGKSSLVPYLKVDVRLETDQFWYVNGEYKFDFTRLKEAHLWCQEQTELMMNEGKDISVSNTFTQEYEMEPYFKLAEKYGYRVFTLIMENRHGSKDTHNVPEEILEKMKSRFEVIL